MGLLVFLVLSALRGRFTFALWELCEVAELEAMGEGDWSGAARVRNSVPARWARWRLTGAGHDVAALRRRLRLLRSEIGRGDVRKYRA